MDISKLVVKSPYKISYDDRLISNFEFSNFKLVLRRALCGDPNPKTGEYLYYRILKNPDLNEKCLQFILFYNFQKFPPHKHDYHSFLIYLDEKKNKYPELYSAEKLFHIGSLLNVLQLTCLHEHNF